jgi:dihydroflavonol-4-reductase
MNIDLITGATGLLGGNLIHTLLKEDRSVRALVRQSADLQVLQRLPQVEIVYGDITDPSSLDQAMRGIENVYHCAALTSLWNGRADKIWEINVNGTHHIIQAAIQARVKRLIHCSTVDALGISETKVPANEETVWNWDRLGVENPYARSKFEAQKLVLGAAQSQLDAVIVNPTTMFGAYDLKPSSGQIILLIAGGKLPFYPVGGDNFVNVEDVASGMVKAAQYGQSGACYILGHENVTYKDIFDRIATQLNVSPPRVKIPYQISRIGGWFGDIMGHVTGVEQTINTNTVQLGALDHYYCSKKAVKELGLTQSPVDKAIEHAIQWFIEVGKIKGAICRNL